MDADLSVGEEIGDALDHEQSACVPLLLAEIFQEVSVDRMNHTKIPLDIHDANFTLSRGAFLWSFHIIYHRVMKPVV